MTESTVTRDVESGPVRGLATPEYRVFYSIPYAAPPIGAARFEEPRAHAPWSGVRDATTPGPTAPQLPRGQLGPLDVTAYFAPGWVEGDDYLTVNVWTPSQASTVAAQKAPVFVYVHGGAFIAGSSRSPLIDGRRFAEHGVVVVTVNYRLGLAGFLDVDGAPRNRGLADVIAALRWVQRNIAAFGGDPANVTLAGHSAGAFLTAAAIASPDTGGLFRRAIMQSGTGTGAFTPEQAALVRESAAKALGVPATLGGFASLTDRELLAATPILMGMDLSTTAARDPLQRITPLGIVLDEQPAAAVARGHGQPVDLLVGHTTEEGNLYLLPTGVMDATTPADLYEAAAYAHPAPERLLEAYSTAHAGLSHGELRSAILGDAVFGAGSRSMADNHAATSTQSTFAYAFQWRSSALGGRLGAAHIVDVPFAFDTIGPGPELQADNLLLGADPAPRALAQAVHAAWCEFIATGSPGWKPYDLTDRTTMILGENSALADDPYAAERTVWT
ncbi:MAG TPA: carboxylesterase family protein [Actinocrinis sp.]|nr:carboxylesterase family protein [Actinocrinis sp.]